MSAFAGCDAPLRDNPESWLPGTPFPVLDLPAPHPASDCPFYQAAWQTFLHVSQPGADGEPAFLSYPGIGELFDPAGEETDHLDLSVKVAEEDGTAVLPEIGSGVEQAGLGGLLIDGNGRPIYYAIHLNDRFAEFVRRNGLTTPAAVLGADPSLAFDEPGIIELKSAWRILTPGEDRSSYFWKRATVPHLVASDRGVVPDPSGLCETVDVALVALHVVFTMEGHPEFIWSTFEHVDREKRPDSAPEADANPEATDPDYVADASRSWLLYRAGASAAHSNLGALRTADELAAAFDEASQSFTRNGGATTPIYREYPASKMTTTTPDEDLELLNASVWSRFLPEDSGDMRQHYRLVGATWLDRPDRDFAVGREFINAPGQSSDEGPVAGEDALSSLAMESFTQSTYHNCFSCHDTQLVVTGDGDALEAKAINVSRVFSRFLSGHN